MKKIVFFIILSFLTVSIVHAGQKNIYDQNGNFLRYEYTLDPKEHQKISTGASSNGSVIVPPSDGSYWKCSKHAGKNFEDLMNCAQDSFKSKNYNLSYNCSYCARELRPDDNEAIILNFKANYYSSHSGEKKARKFLIEILSRRIKEQPADILVAFKKWVEGGGEVDAFVIKKLKTNFPCIVLKEVNVRSKPSLRGEILGSLPKGYKIIVKEEKNGWAKIGNGKWVYSKFLLEE